MTERKGREGRDSQYSEEYRAIKKEIQDEWPDWKRKMYNEEYAVSAHARKISTSLQ